MVTWRIFDARPLVDMRVWHSKLGGIGNRDIICGRNAAQNFWGKDCVRQLFSRCGGLFSQVARVRSWHGNDDTLSLVCISE
jgi:hypothetical protein